MYGSEMKRILLIISGFISLGLGITGIFLPLLPTTPFLLLSAGCFFRSSDTLYNWLINHRIFGRYIRCYREYKAVSKNTKIFTILLLWFTISLSILAVSAIWVRITLIAIAIGVTVHVLLFKTLTPAMLEEIQNT